MKVYLATTLLLAVGCVDPATDVSHDVGSETLAVSSVPTAYRITDLDLRDPHVRIRFLGCIDVTDTPFFGFSVNGQIATSIGSDTDGDGAFDFSPLVVFRPLDQQGVSTPADALVGSCTATSPTSCSTGGAEVTETVATNTAAGTCLAPAAGTTGNYNPPVTAPTNACFATDASTLSLSLAGIPITLSHARVGAEYSGDPATGLIDGLLSGFISEADANATTLPTTLPLVGGRPLSSLLAGGTGNCATRSDKDIVDGVAGWWFYLNFSAQQVPWVDAAPE